MIQLVSDRSRHRVHRYMTRLTRRPLAHDGSGEMRIERRRLRKEHDQNDASRDERKSPSHVPAETEAISQYQPVERYFQAPRTDRDH